MYCSTNQIKTRFTIQSYELPPQRRALSNAISEVSHASKKTFQSAIKSIGEKVPKNVSGLKEKSKFFISTHGLEDLSESSKHISHHHKNLHSSPSPPKSILRNQQLQNEVHHHHNHHSFSPPKRVSSRVSFQQDQNQIKRKSQSKSNPNKAESRYFIGNLHKVEEHFSGSKNKGKQDFPMIEPFGEGTSKSAAARKRPHNSSPVSSTGSATHQPSQRLQRQPSKSQMSQSKISRNEQNRSQRKSSHHRERGREISGGATTMGGGGGEAVNQSEQQQSEKPLKGIAKVAKDYPFLGFAVTGSTMIIGTTAIVTHNLHSKEDEVMRKKKELGLPPVDLEKEKKNAEAKLRQKLGQSSQVITPPPTTQQTTTSPSPSTTTTKKTSPSSPPIEPSPSGKSGTGH